MAYSPCKISGFVAGTAWAVLQGGMSKNIGSISKPWFGSPADCARSSSVEMVDAKALNWKSEASLPVLSDLV